MNEKREQLFKAGDFDHEINPLHPLAREWCAQKANARVEPILKAYECLKEALNTNHTRLVQDKSRAALAKAEMILKGASESNAT